MMRRLCRSCRGALKAESAALWRHLADQGGCPLAQCLRWRHAKIGCAYASACYAPSLALSSDGGTILSAGGQTDKQIAIWSAPFWPPSGRLATIDCPNEVLCVAADEHDSGLIAAAYYPSSMPSNLGGRIGVFTRAGDQTITLCGHRDHIADLALRGDLLVSGGGDAKVKQWSLRGKQCVATLHDHMMWVGSVALSADAILSASGDCTIKVWRILAPGEPSGPSGAMLSLKHDTCIQGVAVDAVQGVAAATISGDTARVWSLHTGECYCTIGGSPPHDKGTFHSVALRGNLLAAGSGDWRIRCQGVRRLREKLRGGEAAPRRRVESRASIGWHWRGATIYSSARNGRFGRVPRCSRWMRSGCWNRSI